MLINGEKLPHKDKDKDLLLKEKSLSLRKSKTKLCSDKEAESGAERLMHILGATDSQQFFLKVMYHLPYETRERILEYSTRPGIKSQKGYFLYCAKRELERLGL